MAEIESTTVMAETDDSLLLTDDKSTDEFVTEELVSNVPHQLVAIPFATANGQIVYHIVPQYSHSETCVTTPCEELSSSSNSNVTVMQPQSSSNVVNASVVTSINDDVAANTVVTLSFNTPEQTGANADGFRHAKWSLVRREPLIQTRSRTSGNNISVGNTIAGGKESKANSNMRPETEAATSHLLSPGDLSDDGTGAGRSSRRIACTCSNCRDGVNRSISGQKKEHICHICAKVYGKTSHLRAHLRWHTGDRPYTCDWVYCNKKFTRSDELQRHLRTHTGEKKFACMFCDKKFMRSDHLAKHSMTHMKASTVSSSS